MFANYNNRYRSRGVIVYFFDRLSVGNIETAIFSTVDIMQFKVKIVVLYSLYEYNGYQFIFEFDTFLQSVKKYRTGWSE